MRSINRKLQASLLVLCVVWSVSAWAGEYALDIRREQVNITGEPLQKITVNGTIPGTTLHFREGEDVTIHVTNHMKETTAIHWHGLLVPPMMDGVPGKNGFEGIRPGETFTYRFIARQAGTYWYHSHFGAEEQSGLYGAIIIDPQTPDEVKADRDYVVLLSEFTPEDWPEILHHLKTVDGYYAQKHQAVGGMFTKKGFQDAKMWGKMRMSPHDLSDVSGYTFLVNGKTPEQNWTGLFNKGERVRLRFINASAMTIYDLRIPGLKMQVVEADGQKVEPVTVDEIRFGNAETYDVIVEPKEDKAYGIVAEPIDRSGFALATLAPQMGMKVEMPAHRPRAVLTMADMGGEMDMAAMMKEMPDMDMSSGWARAGTPVGHKALTYADLRARLPQADVRKPTREIVLRLGGSMQRYYWTINGKKHGEGEPIHVKYGDRVRLKFINDTMMAHPMHLHGMFVQLENGQPLEKLPNKHTVIVPPAKSASVLLTANEEGDWVFHCHMLYHMLTGMMTEVVVHKQGEEVTQQPEPVVHTSGGGHHHVH